MSGYFDALNRRRRNPPEPIVPVETLPAPRGLVLRPVYDRIPAASTAPPAPYEALREKLLVAANGRPLKTIVFAGCDGGEGCTQIVRELAETLAGSGLNVLVVDADRRTQDVTSTIVTPADLEPGEDTRPERPSGQGRLTIVPRRATGPDKEHFFRSPEFVAWMTSQRDQHDYVLLDAPPLLSFADATLMGRVSDGAVIVAQAEATERESLTKANEQLQRAGVKVIGVVLNRARNPVPAFLRPYIQIT